MSRNDILAAIRKLAGVGVVAVSRQSPNPDWYFRPKGSNRRGWRFILADGRLFIAESSDTFRDPHMCQRFLEHCGRPTTIPHITQGETKALLKLLHALAND
jgi:hypothetical protein